MLYGKLRPNLRKVVRAGFGGVSSTDILAIHSKQGCDSAYLNHLLNSDGMHIHAMRGITGTKMPRTSWAHLRSFHFLLPSLTEQRAIAAVLDSIDEAIERTEEVIATTEALRFPAPRAAHPGRPRLAHRVERSPRPRHHPRRLARGKTGGRMRATAVRCQRCRPTLQPRLAPLRAHH